MKKIVNQNGYNNLSPFWSTVLTTYPENNNYKKMIYKNNLLWNTIIYTVNNSL